MADSRPAEELNQAFLDALDEHLVEHESVGEKPLNARFQSPLPEEISAYFYTLKRYDRDDDRFRIQPTSGPDLDHLNEGSMTLLAGYNDQLEGFEGVGLFALFDPTVYTADAFEASSPNRLVGEGAVEQAAEDGFGKFVLDGDRTNQAEFVLVTRADTLGYGLMKKRLRHLVREFFNKELTDAWNDSYQRHVSIEETAINFILETDPAAYPESRYQSAVSKTAEGGYETDIDSSTINSDWDEKVEESPGLVLDRLERHMLDSNADLLKELRTERELSGDLFEFVDDLPDVEELHFPSEGIYETIDTALRSGSHLILTGPPGAGKSHIAEVVAKHYSSWYEVATATDDWTTFDTIGGYREDKSGSLRFHPGIFLQRFLDPKVQDPKNEWLITDELNRADIDKAFGSLFSALNKQNVTLPFETESGPVQVIGNVEERTELPLTDHHYYIPNDWRMIATMNTDDKSSLYRLSYAFMRRFSFIHVPVPKGAEEIRDNMSDYLSAWDVDLEDNISLSEEEEEDLLPEGFDVGDIEQDLVEIWAAVQPFRALGPAIIQDVLDHVMMQLDQGRELDYGPAVATHLFPQLEGIDEKDVKAIVSELGDLEPITMDYLYRFADDYLGIRLDDE